MSEELAYSIHLGSDKNKTAKARQTAKNNPSGKTSFANNGIQNATQPVSYTHLQSKKKKTN